MSVCAHVPAFSGTSISSILTFHQCVFVQSREASTYLLAGTYYYRRMQISQGGNLGRKETSRVVTLCVRRQNPPHTIAALSRRTFQFTNALHHLQSRCLNDERQIVILAAATKPLQRFAHFCEIQHFCARGHLQSNEIFTLVQNACRYNYRMSVE